MPLAQTKGCIRGTCLLICLGRVNSLMIDPHRESGLGGADPHSIGCRENLQAAARWLLHTGWPKHGFCATLVIVTPPGAPGPVIAFMVSPLHEKHACKAKMRQ